MIKMGDTMSDGDERWVLFRGLDVCRVDRSADTTTEGKTWTGVRDVVGVTVMIFEDLLCPGSEIGIVIGGEQLSNYIRAEKETNFFTGLLEYYGARTINELAGMPFKIIAKKSLAHNGFSIDPVAKWWDWDDRWRSP